jgi:hypothetical protein
MAPLVKKVHNIKLPNCTLSEKKYEKPHYTYFQTVFLIATGIVDTGGGVPLRTRDIVPLSKEMVPVVGFFQRGRYRWGETERESRKTELSKRKIDYEARVLFYLLRTTCSHNWIFLLFFKIKYILLFLQEKQEGVGNGYLSIFY